MKVRMNVGIASAEWSYAPGQVVDVDDDLAIAWLESKIAAPFRGKEVERAVAPPKAEQADAAPDWPLKQEPEEYLERYPDGKHAEQARRIVEG